ncbi:MAG: VWA domain-containing protein [Bryobacteraceae bacterium]
MLTTVVAVPLAAALLLGQTAGTQEERGTVIRTDVRLVVLHTTVLDRSGHFVTNLPQQDFSVYENGVRQQIKQFKREDVPVSMGLVIDNSGSMRDKRAKVEAAAMALAKDSNPEDEVFVVNFNDEAFLDLPPNMDFTSDRKVLEEALTRIDSKGGTRLFDSVRMSIDYLKEKAHRDKKVLVVVTDGDDNASDISLENLVKAGQQSEVLIYTVGLLGDEERREAGRAERALKALAVATGGESYFPKELVEVDHIAHQVARDIRSQYLIEYTPENANMDGTYRQIKVAVNAPGRPTVRTRSGYYATPERQAPSPPAGASSLRR